MIELLIAVAVIGILAAIAIPNYQRYVERSRVVDGTAWLMEAASVMERCYTVTNSYQLSCLDGFDTTGSPEGVYSTISLTQSGQAYRLEATGGERVPDACTTLWVRSNGSRGEDGCW
ncbi:type IV pilin protein [Halomonas tibetensis]|uniref:type IV pilin protein n=1 Tax=Halomonas tibetensis TaxID=2259590 RepID=UPI0036D2E545